MNSSGVKSVRFDVTAETKKSDNILEAEKSLNDILDAEVSFL